MNTFAKWLIFTAIGFITILTVGVFLIVDEFNLFSRVIDFLQQFPLLYNFALLGLVLAIFLFIAFGVGIYLIYKRFKRTY